MNRRLFLVIALAALPIGSCVVVPEHGPGPSRGRGPPPHAPAHGYRHRYRGDVVFVFDADFGLYIVEGWPGIYYFDGWFFRHDHDRWERSEHLDGPWRPTNARRLPPGLQKKGKKKKKKRG